jgi:predicted nucleic acid-binding Zn ribbon protein
MVCSECGTRNPSGTRFCEECGSPLRAQCPSCGQHIRPDARFCGNCGARTGATAGAEGSAATATARASDVGAGTHPSARLTATAAGAERRLVSVLFADLVGFTTYAEDRDPEEVRETLTRYFELGRDIIESYGGNV